MENPAVAVAACQSLICVIIPTYNDASLLKRAIDSVLKQTYPHIEIIVINDGSTDDGATDRVAEAYGKCIRYVKTENRGVSAARNTGIKLAEGEYIAFLDADDFFLPDKIEKQFAHMFDHNLAVCHTSYTRLDQGSGHRTTVSTKAFVGRQYPDILRACGIATPTVMVRRDALKDLCFRTDFHLAEDTCLWIDLAFRYPLGQIDEPLTVVTVGEQTAAYGEDTHIGGMLNVMAHITQNPIYRRNIYEIEALCKDILAINATRLSLSNNEWAVYHKKKKSEPWTRVLYYRVLDFLIAWYHKLIP